MAMFTKDRFVKMNKIIVWEESILQMEIFMKEFFMCDQKSNRFIKQKQKGSEDILRMMALLIKGFIQAEELGLS